MRTKKCDQNLFQDSVVGSPVPLTVGPMQSVPGCACLGVRAGGCAAVWETDGCGVGSD